MIWTRFAVALLFAAACGLAGCAHAAGARRGYDPRPYIRECTRAARAAQGSADSPAAYGAVHHLAGACPDYPVRRLPELWTRVPADSALLKQLLAATEWRGEGRPLFYTLVAVAVDSARPGSVRAHALEGLLSYYRPGTGGVMEAFQDTVRRSGHYFTHPSYAAAASILPADRDSARRMLGLAGPREADRRMWHALGTFQQLSNAGVDRWDRDAARRCTALAASAAPTPHAPFMPPDGLAGCTSVGPDVLARAWEVATDDSVSLAALLSASQHIRDQRTLSAVLRAGRDPSRPPAVRFAALHVAATLAHPAMYALSYETWMRDPETCYGWWGWYHHHVLQEDGAVPLGPDSQEEIRAELRRIGRSAAHPQVRRLASLLARCIGHP